jgi:hypothetical protein
MPMPYLFNALLSPQFFEPSIRYPLIFWPMVLVPGSFFLLGVWRFCQQRQLPPWGWVLKTLLLPCWAIPALYVPFQPVEKQKPLWIRLFIVIAGVQALFIIVAWLVDKA